MVLSKSYLCYFLQLFAVIIQPEILFSQSTVKYDTITFWKDGGEQTRIMKSEGIIKDGQKIGVWKKWYPSGQLADSSEFIPVRRNNIKIIPVPDHIFRIDTNAIYNRYANKYSIETGPFVSYFEDGKLSAKGSYLPFAIILNEFVESTDEDNNSIIIHNLPYTPNPTFIGHWIFYNENGTISEEFDYDEAGKLIEK